MDRMLKRPSSKWVQRLSTGLGVLLVAAGLFVAVAAVMISLILWESWGLDWRYLLYSPTGLLVVLLGMRLQAWGSDEMWENPPTS